MRICILVIFTIFQIAVSLHSQAPSFFVDRPTNVCDGLPYKLVFFDEFDGGAVDASKWYTYYPYGTNQSDQCDYCRRPSGSTNQIYLDNNVQVSNGTAKINTVRQNATWLGQTSNFTTGILYSKQTFNTYTKYEIRCKVPKGKGLWPAFWMFGWSTEIDVFEFAGHEPNKVHTSVHKWGPNGTQTGSGTGDAADYIGIDYSLAMHTYAVEYETYHVKFYIDGVLIRTMARLLTIDGNWITGCTLPTGIHTQNEYYPRHGDPVSVIASMGVASGVGSPFGLTSPDNSTVFPNVMEIDYIRVFQKNPQSGLTDICGQRLINGPSIICATQQVRYELSGLQSNTTTWTTSSNLAIVSQTSNYIIVQPISSSSVGSAWVKANNVYLPCTTNELTKNIWIGKPDVPQTSTLVTNCDPCFELNFYSNSLSSPTYSWSFAGTPSTSKFYCANRSPYSIGYSVVASNVCGSSAPKLGTAVGRCTSGGPKRITIYPNPATSFIDVELSDIKMSDIIKCYIISNIDGSVTEATSMSEEKLSIDLTKYSKGAYYLKLVTIKEDESITEPFIIE